MTKHCAASVPFRGLGYRNPTGSHQLVRKQAVLEQLQIELRRSCRHTAQSVIHFQIGAVDGDW
jgi:hypothetical protein